MPVTLVSVGESPDSGELAFMDAMGHIAPAVNEAASSVIVSRETVPVPGGGFRVTLRIVLFDENEVAQTVESESERKRDPLKGEAKRVQDRSEDYLALYAARLHGIEIAQAQDWLSAEMEQTETIAHTTAEMQENFAQTHHESHETPHEAEPGPEAGEVLLEAFAVSGEAESAGDGRPQGLEANPRHKKPEPEPELNPVA